MPPGEYYIGDLCYVLSDSWTNVCDLFLTSDSILDGEMKFRNFEFAIYATEYGDGCYRDQNDNAYSVDSGTLGCVALQNCEVSKEEILKRGFGHIVTFNQFFRTGRNENGVIYFGNSDYSGPAVMIATNY